MEKLATLLWILFGLGAFVFRLIKKAQETTAREMQERPRRTPHDPPALPTATFQEMLRQMQARNAAAPDTPRPVVVPPVPQPAPHTLAGRPMPREVARPARSQERTAVTQRSLEAPATARPHNAPAPPAQRSSGLPRASARQPLLAKAEAPAPVATAEAVREMLRRPESVRAAFVLSEIFARKYE
ncbi:hypothetical protein [Hymenobacter armeniacus]|uniref:Uncharacterized protein n=1 Tax=Hymenobacter armeniacus TaxID=2771358 RepID=A0ABR8JLQ5_9BACT|nr:hypothetical protein [Hymenobacter armeniacus]MBD2720922.1 hypothetical protein [Hymenobacter armeniacus]